MTSVPKLSVLMHQLLTHSANEIARHCGFVQRRSKLSGAAFVQTLIWGWQSNPAATLEELAQTAATCGLCVSPQAIDQRFTPQAAALLRAMLVSALDIVVHAEPPPIELLQRFSGVFLLDSTLLSLPDALAQEWPGCGNRTGNGNSALKVSARLDLSSGELLLELMAGRAHDRSALLQDAHIPQGALRLADVGSYNEEVVGLRLAVRLMCWQVA